MLTQSAGMKQFCIIAVLVTLPATIIRGQDTLALKEAIQTGLKNNYAIQIAEKNLAIDKNNVSSGNAGLLPSLNLNATQTNSSTNTFQEFISGETIDRTGARAQSLNARAELRWTLFDGFQMFTTYDQLKEIREKGNEEFRETVINTVSSIINQYFKIARQQQQVSTQKEALALSRRRKSLAETRMNVGSGSKLAYMQAKVDYNSDTSAYVSQKEALESAKIRLNEILSRDLQTSFTVSQGIPVKKGLQYQDLKQATLENNPGLRSAKQDKRIATLKRKNIQAEKYPDIGFNLGYNFNQTSTEAGFVSESQESGPDYGFFLNYNLFNGFNIQRRQQNAKLAIDRSSLAFKQRRQSTLADLRTAFTNYQNNRSLIPLEKENVAVARESLAVAKENFEAGGLSYLALKEAQQNYLDAQNRLTKAKYQTKQAEIKLLRITGLMLQKRGIQRGRDD